MHFSRHLKALAVALLAVGVVACDQPVTEPEIAPQFARGGQGAGPVASPYAAIALQVDDFNAEMVALGSALRLDYPWLFVVGDGTDPFARLRTGSRWTGTQLVYIQDTSDYGPSGLPLADARGALASAFDSWNAIPQAGLTATEIPHPAPGLNLDVLDGTFGPDGCGIIDESALNYDAKTGSIFPVADIFIGGFPAPAYFAECLGSPFIIGVTWTFSFGDANGDQYLDRLYVEQYYNPAFEWVTSGSTFLGDPVDLETIAVHEHGHAHGLGHFGGPVRNQPLTLKPNGGVFNPTAVMNPIYFGGENRSLFPTDEAAFLTMYARD